MAITDPILTPRLRLEPVTAGLMAAAERGPQSLSEHILAEAPDEWISSSYRLLLPRSKIGRFIDFKTQRALVVHRTEKRVIGDVRFEAVDEAVVEIGYAILPAYRRLGFAVEAMTALIDELWQDAAIDTLIGGCDMKNIASIRTLRRLGFELDITRGRAFWWRLDRPGTKNF
ncbi:MAG: GNAT family N-acetyltransferase [Caulobacterales bacterium]|jgi:ribosomal-protein-alanine N-acetyltransferase